MPLHYQNIKSMYMMNTTNPNCFTYNTDELLIEFLGGVRIDTLDRMRVTIKVTVTKRKHPQYTGELAGLAVRHKIDFFIAVKWIYLC